MNGLYDRLKRIFEEGHGTDLPGLRTDAAFAPPGEIRPAAVMVAITNRPDPGVILTQRPTDMRQHPGQIAFPGGKLDPGEDAVAAALRETYEELGIDPAQITIIGESDRFITGTGYEITPVLGLMPPDLPIHPNPTEVADWFETPLRYILDPANRVAKSGVVAGQMRNYLEIQWQHYRIWGVTAAIIDNLATRMVWDNAWEGLSDD